MQWLYLAIAISAEVIATSALKASNEFTVLLPSVAVILGYGLAFFLLSIVLRTIPIGITYALWSGAGIVFLTLIGFFVYGQKCDWPAILGIVLIIAGIVVLQVFSKTVVH